MELQPFEQVLLAYHRGEIDGNAMLLGTMPRWRALAGRMYREWQSRLPAWVNGEDVLQVVCEAVPRFARSYDPSHGTSMRWYVVHNASDKAEKAIHKWRNAVRSGNARAHAGRFEVPLSMFATEGEDESEGPRLRTLDPMAMATHAPQQQSIETAQFFESVLASARTVPEAVTILALHASGGSLVHAAEILYEDPMSRLECELNDESEARRLVKLTLSDIAKRYTTDETTT